MPDIVATLINSTAAVGYENDGSITNIVHQKSPIRRKRYLTLDIEDEYSNVFHTPPSKEDAWWKLEYKLPPSGHLGAHDRIQPKDKDDDGNRTRSIFETTFEGMEVASTILTIESSSSCSTTLEDIPLMKRSKRSREDLTSSVFVAAKRRLPA